MTIQLFTYPHNQARMASLAQHLRTHIQNAQVPVVLAGSLNEAAQVRSLLQQEQLQFGFRVETVSTWVQDQWELYGPPGVFVSSFDRKLLMKRAVSEVLTHKPSLTVTPGTLDLLCDMARESLNCFDPIELDTLASLGETLSASERDAVAVLQQYATCLHKQGMLESCQALQWLVQHHPCPPPVVLLNQGSLSCGCRLAINRLSSRSQVCIFERADLMASTSATRNSELTELLDQLFRPVNQYPVRATGALSVLLPSGEYATPRLLLHKLLELQAASRATIEASLGVAPEVATTGALSDVVTGALSEAASVASLNNTSVGKDVWTQDAPLIVVAAKNPQALFEALASPLAQQGVSSVMYGSVVFEQTIVGKLFLSLCAFVAEDAQLDVASDIASNAFSGISLAQAHALNKQWRKSRLTNSSVLRVDLSQASAIVRDFVQGCSGEKVVSAAAALHSCEQLCASLKARVHSLGFSESIAALQLSALAQMEAYLASCAAFNTNPFASLDALRSVPLTFACQSYPANSDELDDCPSCAVVEFCTLAQCAEKPDESCFAVVLCDLEAQSYPIKTRETSAHILLEKLGHSQEKDALAEMRMQLFDALSTARCQVVIERVLHTAAGDESYPAAFFDEITDCYVPSVEGGTLAEEKDDKTGLPLTLVPFVCTAGENDLHRNFVLNGAADCAGNQANEVAFPAADHVYLEGAPTDAVTGELLPAVALGARLDMQEVPSFASLVLSASALETYLACPYSWFAQRRLALDDLRSGFGPLEKGSFAHHVLKATFESLAQKGIDSVTKDTVEQAKETLSSEFDDYLSAQTMLSASENPLIPQTKLEEIQVSDLKNNLLGHLNDEVEFLPDFKPVYHEFSFGFKEPVEYAGCALRGSIDRIDINSKNQAVIIDYKGSVTKAYDLSNVSEVPQSENALLPNRIQTLIYAQIAQRLLGVQVVGALYVSYHKSKPVAGGVKKAVSGSYDALVLDAAKAWNLKRDACGVPSEAAAAMGVNTFPELVDWVEAEVTRAVERLKRGDISRTPRGDDCCKYCPALSCAQRRTSS